MIAYKTPFVLVRSDPAPSEWEHLISSWFSQASCILEGALCERRGRSRSLYCLLRQPFVSSWPVRGIVRLNRNRPRGLLLSLPPKERPRKRFSAATRCSCCKRFP